jgi:hypothetical protein
MAAADVTLMENALLNQGKSKVYAKGATAQEINFAAPIWSIIYQKFGKVDR